MRLPAVALLLLAAAQFAPAQDKEKLETLKRLPEPTSYAKPVPGGRFVLVQLGKPEVEAQIGRPADQKRFAELRAKYPRPGLWTAAEPPELVWPLPEGEYAPYDHTFPTADGDYLVRVEGDFWRTEAYPGGPRPSAAEQAAQLDAPAVSFFERGKLLKQYRVRDLVTSADNLQHTPQHMLWYASATLHPESGKFILFTQESVKVTFDYRTGEELERVQSGLGNPLMQTLLGVFGTMTVVILAAWGAFVYFRRVPDSVRLAGKGP